MCITLAFECSTLQPSVALLHDGIAIAETGWNAGKGDVGRLLKETEALMVSQGLAFDAITCYAVGLGPGNFTGLRTSLAAAQALALPGGTPVVGIVSAEAIAAAVRQMHPSPCHVLVVGDARRQRLWMIDVPPPGKHGASTASPIRVMPLDRAVAELRTPGKFIASPDKERLGATLRECLSDENIHLGKACHPTAAGIGKLAYGRPLPDAGQLPEPIYVHPPVFIEPRYTDASRRHG